MSTATLLRKIVVSLSSAVLMVSLVLGGIWLTRHPLPSGGLMPIAMVTGLAALVYGARGKH